jgi:proteic killer suppression protein
MIQSWADKDVERVFKGHNPKGFRSDLVPRLRRVLAQLNAAARPEDMRAPPGNRLHRLSGDHWGKWSVSVNDQFRVTFDWGPDGPENVWFGDYH